MERKCPSCGNDPGGGTFCQNCGARVACPSCGADPGSGAFCQNCGTQLTPGLAPSDPATEPPAAAPTAQPAPTPPAIPTAAVPPMSAAPPPAGSTPPQVPAQATKRSRLGIGCLIIGGIIVMFLIGGGFLLWRFLTDEVLPGVEETTEGFELFPIEEAPPGPCYDLTIDNGQLSGWDEVSCTGPRQVEVSFAAAFDPGPFPGEDFLASTAASTCRSAFETYVGISPEESRYDMNWLVPTEEMWVGGNRQGICLVFAEDGSPLNGTVKESEE